MNSDKAEKTQSDVEIQEQLDAVRDLIMEKRYREANGLLLQILQVDENNKRAKDLVVRLDVRRRIKNFRIALVTIFVVTTMAVALLAWTPVNSTEVAINLVVNQLTFTVREQWNIYSVSTQTLGLSHLKDLELIPTRVDEAVEYDPETDQPSKWREIDLQGSMRIERIENYWNVTFQSGYLNLSNVVIDSGSTVTIGVNEEEKNQLRIAVTKGSVFGTVETGETFILRCNSCVATNLSSENSPFHTFRVITRDREIEFHDLNNSIDIKLEIPGDQSKSSPYVFGKNIEIDEIDFTRFEGHQRESTITQNGEIFFSELDGKKYVIREGDFAIVDILPDFQIKRLLVNDQISIRLHGNVREFKNGTKTFLYSRLPSYLEWVQANQSISIFWGTLIPIGSVIFALFYRLRIVEII